MITLVASSLRGESDRTAIRERGPEQSQLSH